MNAKSRQKLVAALIAAVAAGASAIADANKPAPSARQNGAGRSIEMKVTDNGFEPAKLEVKKAQPVTLVITRVTDATCATEITIDGTDINRKLPLNETVSVTFTPKKSGTLKYGCAMGKMIGGVLVVQ